MRVLISNDDGYQSTGLGVLRDVLRRDHEVVTVAPAVEQSAKSHAFSMHQAIRIHSPEPQLHIIHGTPADCVYIGVHHLCAERPEWVVSGINRGANLGEDVHYSGTVAAAREAALQGIPGLAVSLFLDTAERGGPRHYATAAAVARHVLGRLAAQPQPARALYNLNVPNVSLDALRGLRISRLGRRHYSTLVDLRSDPRGRDYVWIGGPPVTDLQGAEGDVQLVNEGFAVLTPLRVDLTDHDALARLEPLAFEGAL